MPKPPLQGAWLRRHSSAKLSLDCLLRLPRRSRRSRDALQFRLMRKARGQIVVGSGRGPFPWERKRIVTPFVAPPRVAKAFAVATVAPLLSAAGGWALRTAGEG